ncbi:glutamine amidotransferase [Bremerella sp. JC770]|uniref:glutamine amidotransferase n=1 Tax=Bremerella sp. JC770 TaxID=3232137 RepID=UPI00345B4214
MARIYYIGDWAIMLGPVFAETPFNYAHKGTEVMNYGKWLKEALESNGRHEVVSVPTWEFYSLPPGELERVLDEYDVLIFSDVEAKNFQLAPQFFDRTKFGREPLTFPDRIRLIVEAINRGTHAMFLGGWLSFNGEMGKGGWGRTGLSQVLPVTCLEVEDLRESTEGFWGQAVASDHPLIADVDLASMPPILGYNIVRAREDCEVVATWEPTGDPMLAVGQFGQGRVLAYTSDPAPHWGCNFVYWNQYSTFWSSAAEWLLSDQETTAVASCQEWTPQTK